MKIFLQLASCFMAISAASLVDPDLMEWQEFKTKYGKTYKTQEEEEFRMKIFMEKRLSIAEHNAKYKRGEVTYEMGINKFSDTSFDEFANIYLRLKHSKNPDERTNEAIFDFPDDVSLPPYVNWVKRGAVTPVKDQGQCGSCYAFSATGAMEGQHFRKTGRLVSLSEQNLIDCSGNFANKGCNGGFMDNCFEYVIENHGIDSETAYPYEGKDGKCRFKNSEIAATFSRYIDLPEGDENALKKAVARVGPISVAIDATKNFLSYQSGVFVDSNCSSTTINHGVLVVGYGIDSKTLKPYWLVKNSWGVDWGDNGYIKMARNHGNMCGIASFPSYPLV